MDIQVSINVSGVLPIPEDVSQLVVTHQGAPG